MPAQINTEALKRVRAREDQTFAKRIPKSQDMRKRALAHMPLGVPMGWMSGLYRFQPIYVTHGEGARFCDIDGNGYLDFNVCDLSMTMGFGCKPIVEAVSKAVKEGAHFLLPTASAVDVAEELSSRVGLPHWQFTLSATGANVEVLRVARQMTGRRKVAIFEGHYHGHLDQTLATSSDSGRSEPELLGLLPEAADDTIILPFNDLARVEECLAGQDVALLLTEPAMTNCTLVEPQPGFLKGLRDITRRTGTLLCYDEAHTFQFAYGGLVRHWNLESDFVVLGKGLGTGVSFALYGMSEEVADFFSRHSDVDIGPKGIATGGTTYASNIAVSAARAALQHVLTPEGYDHLTKLGTHMAAGLDQIFNELALPWKAQHLGPRTGYCLFPTLPRDGEEAYQSIDTDFIDTRRVYLANRGIWDSVASAGPQVSFAHDQNDIDLYLQAARSFLAEVTAD
jgi:glutamate-1-semialdehyde aminotransferase